MDIVLRLDSLEDCVGRGVRVAIIDSGVHAAHPHVGGVTKGVAFDADGHEQPDYIDRLGHGTAVTAVIREKAPEAEIWPVKVFDRELATTGTSLLAAVGWAVRGKADVVNLSLGTLNASHEQPLIEAVALARGAGIVFVAAAPHNDQRWLPGALSGVVAVTLDWTLPRDICEIASSDHGEVRARASGYPRPIPGVSPEHNLRGASFAVANVTGLLTRMLQRRRAGETAEQALPHLLKALQE